MRHAPRPKPVAPVHAAFDELKRAEEEAVRLAARGHIFQADLIAPRGLPSRG
jgi:hypothetical protein